MKLLYVSSWHGALEYDELKIFTELGIDWFSTGLFLNPQQPSLEHAPRAPLDVQPNYEFINEFLSSNENYKIYSIPILKKEFVDKFDIILISHCCPTQLLPLQLNWINLRHKPTIWRTYTQQTAFLEAQTQEYRKLGLKLVRISPKEATIPYYAGHDAIIRGYLDDAQYYGWIGNEKTVLTFNNLFAKRTVHSNTDIYKRIRRRMNNVNFELYGCDNKDEPLCLGELSWENVKEKYRNCRIYFGLGSKPASATYSILEGMLTGAPVLTWGPKLGNMKQIPAWSNTYEMCDIIENGVNGFYSDDEFEIESIIRELLKNTVLAKKISIEARKTIIDIFGKKRIKEDWKKFFKSLGFTL